MFFRVIKEALFGVLLCDGQSSIVTGGDIGEAQENLGFAFIGASLGKGREGRVYSLDWLV